MQTTNWIILSSKDRGINYGVGTFIKQLSKGLAAKKEINVFILEIGITSSESFKIKEEENIIIFEIPVNNNKVIDSKKNHEKLSRNITRVVSQYIPQCDNTVIHMNYLFQYFIGTELKKVLKGSLIFTQHIFTYRSKRENNFFDIEKQTYNSVDKIITVCKHGKDHLIAKKVDGNLIRIIYNGIDPNKFRIKQNNLGSIKKKYGLTRDENIILFSGRIDNIKGLDYLCSAMELLINKLPYCRLVIAGDGNFEKLIKSSNKFSANISFLGFIPFEDLVALYHVADIGVIPSLEENCSYVALEMLHCGLPVVASNVGGLREIFIHKENAFLTDNVTDKTNRYGIAPKISQLKNQMRELLLSEKLRTKFSQNAVSRANKYFTRDIMTDSYIQTVKKLT